MAKDFKFRTTNNGNICIDKCSIKTSATIGSCDCIYCKFNINYDWNIDTISCPKIIYRHYSERVIMRKK